jgi:DNA-binding protein H-NS
LRPEVMGAIDSLTAWLQLIMLAASVVTLAVTVAKTAQKPNKTQDERLDALESWQKEVNNRLEHGNTHFESIDKGNTVMQNSLLAIMDALINGDNKAELQKQRNNMYDYLTETKGLI